MKENVLPNKKQFTWDWISRLIATTKIIAKDTLLKMAEFII